MGSAISGQVILGCVREKREQANEGQGRKHCPPWHLLQFRPPGSCLERLPWLPWMMDCDVEV